MIVVIADDITGAAEMGGIALRYGLNTLISDNFNNAHNYEVIVIYTNTRSRTGKDAAAIMGELTSQAMQLNPSLFYKKTDSVLRGHVLEEMKSQMSSMNSRRGLLVPINPSSERIIRDGKYFIKNVPVHETSFSIDPEFPLATSSVQEILGDEKAQVHIKKKNEGVAADGVTVGEAETSDDLDTWARYADNSILLAGGGSFFNALLRSAYKLKQRGENKQGTISTPFCLVSGTTFKKNVDRIASRHHFVSYMPNDIFSGKETDDISYDRWLEDALTILEKNDKVIIAIDNRDNKRADAELLREKLAVLVNRLIESSGIADLLIEGGATAYSIVKKVGWHSFLPDEEIDQGIVRMRVVECAGLHLTIKPGSYEWPTQWNFN